MITDNDIINAFSDSKGRVNVKALNSHKDDALYAEQYLYLARRFPDTPAEMFSFKEAVFRIIHEIHYRPLCAVCGSPVEFTPKGFRKTCCEECKNAYMAIERERTMRKKYGKPNAFSVGCLMEKAKSTCEKKYGVSNISKSKAVQKVKEATCLSNYEVSHPLQNADVRKRFTDTCVLRYGVDNPSKADSVKLAKRETVYKKYGVDNPSKIEAVKKAVNESKRRNHTFTHSSPEERMYALLKGMTDNIHRQYKSDEYPFCCDFYIPAADLYIEYQGNWTHGEHPYSLENDSRIVESWNSRASRFYTSAVDTWTRRDVAKRETALRNGLNYLEIFKFATESEIKNIVKEYLDGKTRGYNIIGYR